MHTGAAVGRGGGLSELSPNLMIVESDPATRALHVAKPTWPILTAFRRLQDVKNKDTQD